MRRVEEQSEHSRPSILLVDDVAANLLALEGALEPLNAKLVKARSGAEALRYLLQEDFACVLVDVQMPDIDGFETVRLIRERERTRYVPIIFISASHREEVNMLRGFSEGAVDYVTKPYSPDLLRARVAALIEQSTREREGREALYERVKHSEASLAEARAQALLRAESERARLYSLFLQAPFPIVVLRGPALMLELVNPAATALFGEKSNVGRGIRDVETPFIRPELVQNLEMAFITGEPTLQKELSLTRDGKSEYFNVVAQPTRAASTGQVDGLLICAFDVTEQVRAREALTEAVRLRDEFLSVASHELKTPLTPLALRLQALLRMKDSELPGPVKEKIAAARRHVGRLAKLVDGLLDVTRLTSGKLHLDFEPDVNVTELVRDVVDRHQPSAAACDCALSLGRMDEVRMRMDRVRFEQVLTNLLSNALKYGAGKPVIVALEDANEKIRLTVRDEGIGITPDAATRIFGKFERAVSERHYGGLGLGLYISRQIVDAFGGTITVESAPSKGATFTVELPR